MARVDRFQAPSALVVPTIASASTSEIAVAIRYQRRWMLATDLST